MTNDDQPPGPAARPKDRAAAELGRRGGTKGGAVRAARMTQEERTDAAREAAKARWARIAYQNTLSNSPPGDREAEERRGGRTPKPFVFTLREEEAAEIGEARGTGGHQTLHRRLVSELARGDLTILFTDAQLGELIRYMTRYESGGFQDRLRRAFGRSLEELLRLEEGRGQAS